MAQIAFGPRVVIWREVSRVSTFGNQGFSPLAELPLLASKTPPRSTVELLK